MAALPIRILLVGDHIVMRMGLHLLIETQPDLLDVHFVNPVPVGFGHDKG